MDLLVASVRYRFLRVTPPAVLALATGAFGIGTTKSVIIGLLPQIASHLGVGLAATGLLFSGYALGVFIGAPVLTAATARLPRKTLLVALMLVFTLGNVGCALASTYSVLMAARVLTSLAHGTFFGVAIVVATGLVPQDRKASAVSSMFNAMAMATLLGVPAGAWLGLHFGWHAPFWAMAVLGVLAAVGIIRLVPEERAVRPPVFVRGELAAVVRPQVLIGLATTVMGCAGISTAFTYIDPMLTHIAGFGHGAVSPLLFLCGAGMVTGNALGGRVANRHLVPALVGGLAMFGTVLGTMGAAMHSKATGVLFTGLFGIASFSIASPLQLWVLRLGGCAEALASSLNISAINLGNALGAWIGGTVLEGPGLRYVAWAAMPVTLGGLALSLWSVALDRRTRGTRSPPFPIRCADAEPCDVSA